MQPSARAQGMRSCTSMELFKAPRIRPRLIEQTAGSLRSAASPRSRVPSLDGQPPRRPMRLPGASAGASCRQPASAVDLRRWRTSVAAMVSTVIGRTNQRIAARNCGASA